MLRNLLLIVFSVVAADVCAQPTSQPIDTVLVCAPDLVEAAQSWIAYRAGQGHHIAVVSGNASADEIKREIFRITAKAPVRNVVIFGDAPPHATKTRAQVDTFRSQSQVIRKWGAEPSFGSDNAYADLNEDGVPELATGRLSADTPEELTAMVNKIIAYERHAAVGNWRRRINFVAGVGGFGFLADKILESAAKKFITDGIPAEYQSSMTQASWRSPYSPDPRKFRAQTIEQMNQGCLAWIYLGHGRKRELDYYRVPDGGLPIFSARDVQRVSVRHGAPIAVFLSCYAGAFDSEPDCLAEALLAQPNGPVAVIAGSNVTMPYAMTILGNAMLDELFNKKRETLGEVVLKAKQTLANTRGEERKGLVDQIATLISPDPDLLDEERLEHVRLFHLIGDPLLRIRHPKQITVTVNEYATAGDTIKIDAMSPIDGECAVELVCRRDRMTIAAPMRPRFQVTNEWLDGLQQTYQQANNHLWSSTHASIRDGKLAATLTVPKHAQGVSHVRVFLQHDSEFAMGAADVYVRPAVPVDQAVTADDPVVRPVVAPVLK